MARTPTTTHHSLDPAGTVVPMPWPPGHQSLDPASQQDPGVPIPSRQAFRSPAHSRPGYLALGWARGAAWGRPGSVEGQLHRPWGARARAPGSRRPRRPRRLGDHGQRRRGAVPVVAPPTEAPPSAGPRSSACWRVPIPAVSGWSCVSELHHPTTTSGWASVEPLHPGLPSSKGGFPQQPLGTPRAVRTMIQ